MKAKLLLILIFGISSVQAQNNQFNFSKITYGSPVNFTSARILSLGGAGLAGADVLDAANLSPALLTKASHFIQASAAMSVYKNEEDRSFPYYDNFGGFVDYGSYVFNKNWYEDYSFSAAVSIPNPYVEKLTVALSFNPAVNFDYDYIEEVRTTGFSDVILAYNKISSEGVLRETSFNIAFQPAPDFSVGVHVGVLSGTISQKSEIDSVDASLQNIRQIETNEIMPETQPIRVNIGAAYDVNPFLSLAAVIRLPYKIDFKNKYTIRTQDSTLFRPLDAFTAFDPEFTAPASGNFISAGKSFIRKIEYPLEIGFGVNYKFTNILRATVSADFDYTFWSDTKDNYLPDLEFNDTYRIRVGVEHIFFNNVPFRLGFNYSPLKENKQYTQTLFTAGTGMQFDQFEINLAAGFSNLTYNQKDMFDNGKYTGLTTRADVTDRVSSSDFYGVVDVKFYFDLPLTE